jgi:NADPH-dependent 2,4-dienoyl-CoA reductase/sulfur reductase-like enzyme
MHTTDMVQDAAPDDHDVVIVGGGPAGCSAGVFTARYGLDTVIFDRGRSSIQRCAHLENYLGFPGGIDIETLYALMHDHVEEAGCELVPTLVESVDDADDGFVVETQDGRRVTAERVIAATRYGGEYLRPLDDGGMFETYEYDGEEYEQFNRSYADVDGTTPVDGLYVASPSEGADRQAIIAAGRGARAGRTLIADVRRERGFPDAIADQYDWVRQETELTDEWCDRERWREWFDTRLPDDHDIPEARLDDLREREVDRRLDQYLTDDEIDHRAEHGQDRLLEHLDDRDGADGEDGDA